MLYYQAYTQSDNRQGYILFYLTTRVKHIFKWYTDLTDLTRDYPDAIPGVCRMKDQDTISIIQTIHDSIQDSNRDTLKALLELESLDRLPEGSTLQSLHEYLSLHYNYIGTALDSIDKIDQSVIYED